MAILYFTQTTLLKMTLLFFYLRIFPGTGVRRVLWGTIIFNALFGMVFAFVVILQYRPLHYFWDQWDGEHQGYCVGLNTVTWSNAAISIAVDFWMLSIPLS